MKTVLIAGMTLAACAATPVAAVTVLDFSFGGATAAANVTSKVATAPGNKTLTATARKFAVAPAALTNLSQTRTANAAANSPTYTLRATAPGIGVTGGADLAQLDTNSVGSANSPLREGILFTSNIANFSLHGLKLSFVDHDDTLQILGVGGDGSFVDLGLPGVIRSNAPNGVSGSSLDGFATGVNTAANNGTVVLTLASPTAYFSQYFLTSRVGGDTTFMGTRGQGYRVDAISGAVPEPGTWALLIVGFGFVGVAVRRRRIAVSA